MCIYVSIDYLITEHKISTEKYLPEVCRTDQAMKERGLCGNSRGQILSRTDRTNEINMGFITSNTSLSHLMNSLLYEEAAEVYLLVLPFCTANKILVT